LQLLNQKIGSIPLTVLVYSSATKLLWTLSSSQT